jgi:hypothetical protein
MPYIGQRAIRTSSLLLILMICMAWNLPLLAAERPQKARAEAVPAPTILSIIPAQAEPGSRVMIYGSSFGKDASAFLGSIEIPARVNDGRQLEFTVPQLDAGLYALYIKREDGVIGRTYNFTVLPLRPVLNELSPDRISSCSQGREREITALGQNFTASSLLLFDGGVIRSRVTSSDTIVFNVPQVAGGLHQVMVRNAPENTSVPVALTIESKPEIDQVSVGNEHVNYYDLIIDGRNFQQNSSIYVEGQRIGGRGGQEVSEREKVIFVDCTRLIYQRYPYSPVNKDFRIQVVNPGNEASQVVNVTAP